MQLALRPTIPAPREQRQPKREQRGDPGPHRFGVEGLAEVAVRADLFFALPQTLLAENGAHQNHPGARELGVALDRVTDLETVHAGHADVEQHEIGMLAPDEAKGLFAAIGA